ncbi:trigger factor [Mesorhizobium sp.]|uniref:trigger factor n=1 Tax=Mesorhizobium sp. TaxID=1871066 RepID=UPI000FEA944E|nr:trigger factor [Mesorhizobium sp.]RWO49334.1 MAG: trigger factor [Mesorhizobium sp.]TIN26785.1 MAG: trigger factor [Mesorhizobium sp.]TIN41719.1 MAG: trigger factor [Mesorhizobium sp.]TJU86262.1 MAG: trigger factor [Mesorhizobium sp.]TJU89013.1 MAG: trigger factor [Mesorhizobium sp.]
MQVTETLNSGLKREIKITVPAGDMEAKLMARLSDARSKVRINGFRPGKVPVQHLRKVYGKSFMAEVVNEILNDSTRSIITGRGEKAAMQPEVIMTEDEKEAEKILAGGADFEFRLNYEIIPPIEIKDFSDIKVTRQVFDVPDSEIDEQVKRVAESARTYEPKTGKAAEGDRVTIDYVGKIDGEAFSGGAGTDQPLVLGSKEFIPGFEDQLIGSKAGDERQVTVTFPENYQAAHLAGKEATFDVTVKEVSQPGALEINDEMAKNLGLESLERLREVVRGQIENQFGSMTRQKIKRQLLDQLDAAYSFEAPSKLVEAEFNNIWNQVNRDLEAAGRTFADEETTEEEARAEYMRLAERRVRLGLVLAEIGEKAGVTVSDEELQRGLLEQVRRYPANQQQEAFEFYRSNPEALNTLRAPLFEEKVVDHLLSQISVTDVKVSKEELMADDEDSETAKAKPAKKAAAKKADPNKADDAEEPKKKPAPKKKSAKDAE